MAFVVGEGAPSLTPRRLGHGSGDPAVLKLAFPLESTLRAQLARDRQDRPAPPAGVRASLRLAWLRGNGQGFLIGDSVPVTIETCTEIVGAGQVDAEVREPLPALVTPKATLCPVDEPPQAVAAGIPDPRILLRGQTEAPLQPSRMKATQLAGGLGFASESDTPGHTGRLAGRQGSTAGARVLREGRRQCGLAWSPIKFLLRMTRSSGLEPVLAVEDLGGSGGGVKVGVLTECVGEDAAGGGGVAFVDHDAGEVEACGF